MCKEMKLKPEGSLFGHLELRTSAITAPASSIQQLKLLEQSIAVTIR